MCSIQILISTAEGGKVALLEDLVVAENFRNMGIGTKLLSLDETEGFVSQQITK